MVEFVGGEHLADQMGRLIKAFKGGDYFEMARSSDEIFKHASARGMPNVAALARSINKRLNGLVLPVQEEIDVLSDVLRSEQCDR